MRRKKPLTRPGWKIAGSLLVAVSLMNVWTEEAVHASATGTFRIGAFWTPPVLSTDYNTDANWKNIKDANIDAAFITNSASGLNYSSNGNGITNSFNNGVKLYVTDSGILNHPVYSAADYAALDTALTPYLNDPRVPGVAIKDEPYGYEMEGYANAYKYAKAKDPNREYYVNLFPIAIESLLHSAPGKLVLSNSKAKETGTMLTSATSLGQTFKVPTGISYVDGIDIHLDPSQWSSNETLTLKLYDNPAKTTLLSQASLAGPSSANPWNAFPYFSLHAAVTGGATYYFELTHNGGGDNGVGPVSHSTASVYSDGAAYKGGVTQSYDLFFRLYSKRDHDGRTYENYVDDWINMSGADYVMYDLYPFGTGGDDATYFENMELVRSRSLANGVKYGAFLQSAGIGSIALRSPTLNEKRYNVYTYLTYGYKYLSWFTYWRPGGTDFFGTPVDSDGTKLAAYTEIQTLNSEMRQLGGMLKNLVSQAVYHSGTLPAGTKAVPGNFFVRPADASQPIVEGYFTDASGRVYVMLTNRDYTQARNVDFIFSPRPASLTEISKSTGLEVSVPGYNATNGTVRLALNPGEGRLFALPTGYSPTPPAVNLAPNAILSSSSSLETVPFGWGISKANDGQLNSVSGSYGWTSNGNLTVNHTESITFDLGSARTIRQMKLYPRNDAGNVSEGFPIDFTVQIANSASGPWTTKAAVIAMAKPGNAAISLPFAQAGEGRYVKIEGTNLRQISTETGNPYRMQFAEVEIYGDSLFPYTAARDWNFNTDGDKEGWAANYQIGAIGVSAGAMNITSTGNDPSILGPVNLNLTTSATHKFIRIRMKNNSSNNLAQFFFITTTDTVWNDSKYVNFTINPNSPFTEYVVPIGANPNWAGTIQQLRFDPLTAPGTVEVDYIRITD
ncbi:discoidin domain-containing protein [Cohnella soli]|uniref:Discoidin domain-containing protein n=1 Tax=Cohnella soli TaxID=425005 RepID=A0ABW0HKF4_9BACL